MLTASITSWLAQSGDYVTGLSLLQETGFSGFALTVLAMGEDAYTRTRLERELANWLTTQKDVLLIDEKTRPQTEDSSATGPSEVEPIRSLIYSLMDERAELKARIRARMDDELAEAERRTWAYRIRAITRQIDEQYSLLDFQKQYGYLPSVSDPDAERDDTALLMNVRSYVSRYKAKLQKKTLTPEQRQSYQTLLEQYQGEKNRIELKLSKPNDSHTSGQQTSDRPIHSEPLPSP